MDQVLCPGSAEIGVAVQRDIAEELEWALGEDAKRDPSEPFSSYCDAVKGVDTGTGRIFGGVGILILTSLHYLMALVWLLKHLILAEKADAAEERDPLNDPAAAAKGLPSPLQAFGPAGPHEFDEASAL